jgi:hypothetical protein
MGAPGRKFYHDWMDYTLSNQPPLGTAAEAKSFRKNANNSAGTCSPHIRRGILPASKLQFDT